MSREDVNSVLPRSILDTDLYKVRRMPFRTWLLIDFQSVFFVSYMHSSPCNRRYFSTFQTKLQRTSSLIAIQTCSSPDNVTTSSSSLSLVRLIACYVPRQISSSISVRLWKSCYERGRAILARYSMPILLQGVPRLPTGVPLQARASQRRIHPDFRR